MTARGRQGRDARAPAWFLLKTTGMSPAEGAATSRGNALDQDLRKIASRFVDFTYKATQLPIIVCDETGTIILAIEKKRIGSVHAAARRIVAGEADEVFVSKEEVARDPKMKEGCNCVIALDGRRIGTFGIAGPLEVTRPLVRVSAAVLASWAKEARLQAALRSAADDVFRGVATVSERATATAAEAARTADVMASASTSAAEKVARSGEIVKTVHEIAQKSRILSINGSVEASRAGNQGRAFSVVAREMIQLAEDARGAANQIHETLGDVERSIEQLEGAIARSADLARHQTAALDEVKGVVDGLQRAVVDLMKATA